MREKKTQCICKICGKQFLGISKNAKFCSLRCVYDDQNAKRRKGIVYKNVCQICGKIIETKVPNKNTCSPECNRIKKSRQDKESRLRHIETRLEYGRKYRAENQEYIIRYRENHKERARVTRRKHAREIQNHYCIKGQETLVENYDKALAEDFEGWSRHHRLETHTSEGQRRTIPLTSKELKALGVYYDRPASELIWLRKEEHRQLHHSFKRYW